MKRLVTTCVVAAMLVYVGVAQGIMMRTPYFPPIGARYEFAQDPNYSNGLLLENASLRAVTDVERTPVGLDAMQVFGALLEATAYVHALETNGGTPVALTGPVTTMVRDYTSGQMGTFDTEIVSMSLVGDIGTGDVTVPVVIREDPTRPSMGQTTITDLGGGLYNIESFFDVFTELSVDGGEFMPAWEPGHMHVVPEPATLLLLGLGGLALIRKRRP